MPYCRHWLAPEPRLQLAPRLAAKPAPARRRATIPAPLAESYAARACTADRPINAVCTVAMSPALPAFCSAADAATWFGVMATEAKLTSLRTSVRKTLLAS